MGKPTGFIEHRRREAAHRPVPERIRDFREVELPMPDEQLVIQAARCMDCGVPFCHGAGCPLANRIPDFNDLVCRGRWRDASEMAHATNNFPEFTGRLCPALCEQSCTLSINDEPVSTRQIELRVAERAFAEGWVVPQTPARKSGRQIAIVGSGPAGLAAAQQLARAGHAVVVFEKAPRPGGLLRYGIPDFKLPKELIDRRLGQLAAEGVAFQTDIMAGQDISIRHLRKTFDAVLLTMGAGEPRDLSVPGRELENVLLAMDYLAAQNRLTAGEAQAVPVSAKDRIVAVIGGGDTGSDCVGTAIRQGAKEVHQFEILPQPPQGSNPATPWPLWPLVLRTSTSQEEGCHRRWGVLTKGLSGRAGKVAELHAVEVDWVSGPDGLKMVEKPSTAFSMKADLVLLALGFVHVPHGGIVAEMRLSLDPRGNVMVNGGCMSSEQGVFAAGDTAEGASLVVRAIGSGRRTAEAIDHWLKSR